MRAFQKSRDRTVAAGCCSRQSNQDLPWQRVDKGDNIWDLSHVTVNVFKVDDCIWCHHVCTPLQGEQGHFLSTIHLLQDETY